MPPKPKTPREKKICCHCREDYHTMKNFVNADATKFLEKYAKAIHSPSIDDLPFPDASTGFIVCSLCILLMDVTLLLLKLSKCTANLRNHLPNMRESCWICQEVPIEECASMQNFFMVRGKAVIIKDAYLEILGEDATDVQMEICKNCSGNLRNAARFRQICEVAAIKFNQV
jgi:hypothetical protein